MFCTKCGSQIPDDANFCPNCQAPVNKSDAAPTTVHTNSTQSNSTSYSTPSDGIDFQKVSKNCLTSLKSGCSVQNLKLRIIGFVGILLLFIGNFLPVMSAKLISISTSYISEYGISVIIMAIITVILLLMKKDLFACISAGISAILIFRVAFDVASKGMGMVKLSIGFYVMLLGVIAIVANFFLVKKNIHIIK